MLRPSLTLLRRAVAPALLALALTPVAVAVAKDKEPPIRIGEINSYTAIPAFLGPYKKGWQPALEQVNAEGGVLGRKLEVISRDDNGNPEGRAAVRRLPVQHRAGPDRLRQAAAGVLPGRRAANRQDHLA
ncbi:hypothetical protein G6F65_021603 [Rhizopus arrhizus]|nr:hypothetical protein G6F65_021603 [Rhizopus arrhizus]